jgi:nicotinic acid mononucleotide adenylyltransferase
VTASVATVEAHRGAHRAHIAVVAGTRVLGTTLTLEKGSGIEKRKTDGETVDAATLQALFVAAGLQDGDLSDWSARARRQFFARPYWTAQERRLTEQEVPANGALFPGAFNPPHTGHFAIAEAAGQTRAVFALCADPPNKPAVDLGELLRRCRLLRGRARLFTEGDALYLDKARRFPGRAFLIGSDALVRMLDPRWGVATDALLTELSSLDARFEVTGRLVDGEFLPARATIDTHVPAAFRDRFVAVPGRWDLSSTALRAQRARGAE